MPTLWEQGSTGDRALGKQPVRQQYGIRNKLTHVRTGVTRRSCIERYKRGRAECQARPAGQ